MHNGNSWGWLPMAIVMVAFWAGLIWIGVTLIKRSHHAPELHTAGAPMVAAPAAAPKPTAQEVLADRLARGEIEPDDYRARLEALRSTKD
jgi:putative membrane protein